MGTATGLRRKATRYAVRHGSRYAGHDSRVCRLVAFGCGRCGERAALYSARVGCGVQNT